MSRIQVRGALLDDAQAICGLFRSHITTWQRINAAGQVEDVPYDALTIYERWLHGGPWMSIETGTLQLSHLLRGAGIPLVAERDGRVLAYAEAYHGVEPAPFGDHLHLGRLTIHAEHIAAGLDDALIEFLVEQTRASQCQRLTASSVANDPAARALFARHGLALLASVQRVSLPARTGQIFYKAVEHLSSNPAQISGWSMPVGRLTSARQQWETLWPRTWFALPELRQQRAHRLHISVAGQEALVYCQQQMYAPRSADIYCWSPKSLTGQVLTAVRDWSHREGYRSLVLAVPDESLPLLGADAEPDGAYHEVYALDV